MSKDDNYRKEIRVRFAPSPTGFLHVGGLRTALFNWLFARKYGGKFILRIEDTDQKRYVPEAVENLINTLKKLGIDYDEGPDIGGSYAPYIQSQRIDLYNRYAQRLIKDGYAYYCFCSEEELAQERAEQKAQKLPLKYSGKCRYLSQQEVERKLSDNIPHVIRLRFPQEGTTVFHDEIRGRVEVQNSQIDDQVLIKSDGCPTYHLANVVDDHLMHISHVIRGEEWLSSVPKHIYLYKALGWKPPVFVHLPLLLNPDKTKLSKRQGDVAVEIYLEKGYLPEALLNFVALLGWHPSEDREIYSMHELIDAFSLDRVTKSGAVFDIEKLRWMNGYYLRNLPLSTIAERALPFFKKANIDTSDTDKYHKVVELMRQRVETLEELALASRRFYTDVTISEEDKPILLENSAQEVYSFLIQELGKKEQWSISEIKDLLKKTTSEIGIKGKKLYFPLRLALFGSCHGPDIPAIIDALGKEETVRRLKKWYIK